MTIEQHPASELTAGVPEQPAPPVQQAPINPLLARIQLPGEHFKLPSGGLFYTDGELSVNVKDAEVQVHPMTVLDEIMIKTPDMLFSGKAVQEVFGRCIPDVIKPNQLLAKDVDFLLLCLRKVSYGNSLEMEDVHFGCPAVEDPSTHSYVVDVSSFIKNSKSMDPTTAKQHFFIELPNQQKINMTPIRFADFVTLMQVQDQDERTPEEQVKELCRTLANIIVNVDEITDKQMIIEWLSVLKPEYLKLLHERLEDTIQWGPDFLYKYTCKDCEQVLEVIAPLNPLAFFT